MESGQVKNGEELQMANGTFGFDLLEVEKHYHFAIRGEALNR